jgi:hypothetical protein
MGSLDEYLAALTHEYRNLRVHIGEQAVMVLMRMAQKDCIDFRPVACIEALYRWQDSGFYQAAL